MTAPFICGQISARIERLIDRSSYFELLPGKPDFCMLQADLTSRCQLACCKVPEGGLSHAKTQLGRSGNVGCVAHRDDRLRAPRRAKWRDAAIQRFSP